MSVVESKIFSYQDGKVLSSMLLMFPSYHGVIQFLKGKNLKKDSSLLRKGQR